MSREIKFRVWSNKRNRYYKIRRIEFDLNRNATHVIVWEEDYLKFNIEHLIIEQYTGVKDKNGVEIYEGDIVSTESEDYIKKWFVDFEYGEFCLFNGINSNLRFSDIELTIVDNCYIEDIKIIGNIHENKENENEHNTSKQKFKWK